MICPLRNEWADQGGGGEYDQNAFCKILREQKRDGEWNKCYLLKKLNHIQK